MQFTVNVECTPEEARSFLGLPDLKPIQDRYIQTMMDTMAGQVSTEQMETMIRNMSPFGDAGMKFFSNMIDIGMASAGVGGSKKS